jgi:PHD/YefM family antitoxin component YafN of YafNO toxin-antitoxin module/mRNA-degrading endonuclease RelE of RelBE toxin-antitoxin system
MALYQDIIEADSINQPVRTALLATEVMGRRTAITRQERPIAVLISWDEFISLRETVELESDEATVAEIRAGEAELVRKELSDGPVVENVVIARSAGPAVVLKDLEELGRNPILGAPLLASLRGLWVLRVSERRVVYRINRDGSMVGVVHAAEVEERP